jgi:hypothetical protein
MVADQTLSAREVVNVSAPDEHFTEAIPLLSLQIADALKLFVLTVMLSVGGIKCLTIGGMLSMLVRLAHKCTVMVSALPFLSFAIIFG